MTKQGPKHERDRPPNGEERDGKREESSGDDSRGQPDSPDPVEEADEESFPASDVPAWNPMHSGPPDP